MDCRGQGWEEGGLAGKPLPPIITKIIQMPEDDVLDLSRRTKGMESDYILHVLKVETIGYSDGLEMAWEKKIVVKITQDFLPQPLKKGVAINQNEKGCGQDRLTGNIG